MNCTDVFVAALAAGLGWYSARMFLDKFLCTKPEWSKRKKALFICIDIAVVLYIAYICDTTILPF